MNHVPRFCLLYWILWGHIIQRSWLNSLEFFWNGIQMSLIYHLLYVHWILTKPRKHLFSKSLVFLLWIVKRFLFCFHYPLSLLQIFLLFLSQSVSLFPFSWFHLWCLICLTCWLLCVQSNLIFSKVFNNCCFQVWISVQRVWRVTNYQSAKCQTANYFAE